MVVNWRNSCLPVGGLDLMRTPHELMKTLRRSILLIETVTCFLTGLVSGRDGASHFDRVVAPVLAGRCLECHSGTEPKGELDLSGGKAAFTGGESGVVIVAGDLEKSALWEQVARDEMPPKHPLPEEEKKILREWIEGGAVWGEDPIDPFRFSSGGRAGYDWWSLQPLVLVEPPSIENDAWSQNEIDHFVLKGLKENGWEPSPKADPRTLVRRLYFDLIGLPAPVEAINRFARDPSEEQWAGLVDELLASKHYGERWARHWMDIARFGESGGFEYNTPRHSAWHYRDWLIRSLNDDLPYNQFARMQLAGDLLKPNTVEGAAAVGFLVAGVHNEVFGKNPKMKMAGRQDELEEIVGTVAQAFVGMTVQCARCHDHKFDPISATEYYQFAAALDGIHHGIQKLSRSREGAEEKARLESQRAALQRKLRNSIASRSEGRKETNTNLIELKNSLEANQREVVYQLSLKLLPTTWAGAGQATREGDGVVVRILGGDGRVIAAEVMKASAWEGGGNAHAFQNHSFSWKGKGSGPIRIQVQSQLPGSGRFGGAIDDLVLSEGETIHFQDNFDQLKQTQPPGRQEDTRKRVFHSARSEHWSHRGINAIHAVEHSEGNLAVQFFSGHETGGSQEAVTPEEKKWEAGIAKLDGEIAAKMVTEVFTVRSEIPGIMRVHKRGDVTLQEGEVAAGGLRALRGLSSSFEIEGDASDGQRRTKLAEWITSPDNSLFHRVAVNRVWHHHFGQGIVSTPNDFGFSGGRPSHPELLDWLAIWFRDHGYSMKKLHRLILSSSAWRQGSSETNLEARKRDGDNRFLWRQAARRVDAEAFRDGVLFASGSLNSKMYGPPFKDVRIHQVPPAHYYLAIDPVGPEFDRRTIYRWHVRGQRNALLDTFDCPDPSVSSPARSITTTPSQALSQWNHPFILRMSGRLAKRVEKEAGAEIDEQVKQAWQLVLARIPDEEELSSARDLVGRHGLATLARVLFNSSESIWID